MRLNLVPAYGRDYKSAKAVREDWDKDKDFTIQDMSSPWNGRSINKSQTNKGDTLNIRYKNLTEVCIVKV